MKRKVIAIVLSAGMIFGSIPAQTWADESTQTNTEASLAEETSIEEEVQVTEDTESTFIYEETHEGIEIISNADIDASYAESMLDNDELMQGYIEQLFSTDSICMLAANEIGPMILSGDSLVVYNCMAEKIKEIACGNTDQAIIEIPISLLDVKMSMTSEELGQTWTYDATNGYQGIDYTPLYAQLNANFSLVMDCLLRDFPYEMYWYDKTGGFTYSTPGASASITRSGTNVYGDIHFAADAHYTITMDVADAYRKSNSQFKQSSNGRLFYYEVDLTNITRVNTALSNAAGILENYRRYDDYSKLVGYKNAICDMVDYNHPAADDSTTPFGDPWQLVYVFDGDPATKVVCEGYSKAFQYLCNKTTFSNPEITCYIITGQMQGGSGPSGGHMWNIVHMDDGKNYVADVTNSDNGSVGYRGGLFLNGMTYMSDYSCYTANALSGTSSVYYWYDNETKDLYSADQLSLSTTDYRYNGTGEPEPEEAEVEIYGNNISLFDDGTFRVNTYLQVPDSYKEAVYVQAEYDDLYSSVYGSGNKWMDVTADTLVPVEAGAGCVNYVTSFAVNSGELTRLIHFSLKNAANELLDEVTVSATDILYYYLSDAFTGNSDYTAAELSYYGAVSKAALNYGSAAQVYFGNWYEADGKLANSKLSSSEKQISPIAESNFVSGNMDYRLPVTSDQLKGVTYSGSSLILQGEIMIRHYFLPDDETDKSRITFSLNSSTGIVKDLSTGVKGSLIYVEYPATYFNPEAEETLCISSYVKGGSTESRSEFTYSLMNYYGRVYMGAQNEALVTLVNSLYCLGESIS